MGATARGRRPHPALTTVLVTVVGLVLLAFPVALYANVTAMSDGYRAAHGRAGTPGTAIVEAAWDAKGGQVCRGTFTPADGGPAVETDIDVEGRCKVGQEVEARLMPGRPSPFTGYDRPRAWEAGSGGWGVYVPLVVLFGLLSLPALLILVMAAAGLAKRLRALLAG